MLDTGRGLFDQLDNITENTAKSQVTLSFIYFCTNRISCLKNRNTFFRSF